MEQPGTQTVLIMRLDLDVNQLTTKGASGQTRAIREDIVSRSFLSCLLCWLELVTIKLWNTCLRTLYEMREGKGRGGREEGTKEKEGREEGMGGREKGIPPHTQSIDTHLQAYMCTLCT